MYCTLRFESKHSYFKTVTHQGRNFKNVCKSLAEKHQLLQAYYMSQSKYLAGDWTFNNAKLTSLTDLPGNICQQLKLSHPHLLSVMVCASASFHGTLYKPGLCIMHGFLSGLPEFSRLHMIIVIGETVFFICKSQLSWFDEHTAIIYP